jgi:hypothetical protein
MVLLLSKNIPMMLSTNILLKKNVTAVLMKKMILWNLLSGQKAEWSRWISHCLPGGHSLKMKGW